MDRTQAEALTWALRDSVKDVTAGLATKAEMDRRFEQVDIRFEQVDIRFDKMDARLDKMDARLDKVDARFDAVDARFEQVDARFEQVDAALERLPLRVSWWILLPLATATGLLLTGRQLLTIFG